MKVPLAYLATSLISSSSKDAAFNSWCSDCGIKCPTAEVRTTPKSVAGRGVFTTSPVSKDDVVISIPYYMALTQDNGATYLPRVADSLRKCRPMLDSPIRRFWNHIRRRKSVDESSDDKFWQAELTAYAIEALETNHPWSTWISQWKRDDPYQHLVDMSTWKFDVEPISKALSAFSKMAPDIPSYKVNAAIGIRLSEMHEYVARYQNKAPCSESMYATLTSRALGLSDTVTACLPMYDMINHSFEPNLALSFNDGNFDLVALRDIPEDSELFLSYMDVTNHEGEWDEDKAAWMLVQWGIPTSPRPTAISAPESKSNLQEDKESLLTS
ncbi:hypothetical protein HJC23_013272 [Cyclotella cryptica]|uniref:SET domain-containing protein n=1 Tax=Cyclotella cryptica TaxID=29204 RepID=A0ABD3PG88_9STRA|eukprot:CCRYP_014927-RA/>CCRYP_014927-RA protein AED:0.13 eAED:0.12 QI:0/-1/0/1/-1/1/1/0/326